MQRAMLEQIGGVDWKKIEEPEIRFFWNDYVEWQRGVKSPVSPKPTKLGSFGELLGKRDSPQEKVQLEKDIDCGQPRKSA